MLKIILFASLFLSSCTYISAYRYNWEKTREPISNIEWKIVTKEKVREVCHEIAEYNPIACTVSRKDKCVIYSTKSVIDEHAEIVKHEISHCLGYTHKGQI